MWYDILRNEQNNLDTLTKYAAAELANRKIRVNAICPCPVKTNSLRYVNVSDAEISQFEKKMEKNIPMGRMALPEDIVKVVSFLASQRFSKITGQVSRVDGGRGLTSSGYVHYRGMRNMNSRFEPDGVNMAEWFGSVGKMFTGEKDVVPIQDAIKLKQFIDEKIRKWSIRKFRELGEKFKIAYTNRFEEGEFRKRVQFMFPGKLERIRLRYTGSNVEAVLDRLPTAKVISQEESGVVLEAEVYGKGILMWILSQGTKIEVLHPQSLRQEMYDICSRLAGLYAGDAIE